MHGYWRAVRTGRETLMRTQTQVTSQQSEHPLRALAIIAGAAFVTGVSSRIWRSRSL